MTTDNTDSAKKDLISAFEDIEDDGDFLVAKHSDLHHEEELTEEEKYVIISFCMTITNRAKRERILKERARQWESNRENPIMGHYWDDEARLDDGEKFLRDYITNMGWKTKDKINKDDDDNSSGDDDEEDEEFLDKMDEFETKYNFRFEEDGGHAIASHSRHVGDSVRVKESKRKKERDSKKERRESEKRAKLAELQRLKNLKQAEINARLKELEQVTGNKVVSSEIVSDLLDGEFDPSVHDQQMDAMLGDDYYDQEDEEGDFDQQDEPVISEEEEVAGAEEEDEEDTTPCEDNLWFYCDSCIRPIRPGNMGYECKECVDETTECHNCHMNKSHEGGRHRMKKFLVGEDEIPPSNWQEVLYDIKKKRTRDIQKGKFDELYKMDYEDLIAGDVACRFKYTNVDSDSFGLSTNTILIKSDKELNSMVSLKKIHPYRKENVMKRVRYHDKNRSRQ